MMIGPSSLDLNTLNHQVWEQCLSQAAIDAKTVLEFKDAI